MSETQTERLMEESPAYGSKALAVDVADHGLIEAPPTEPLDDGKELPDVGQNGLDELESLRVRAREAKAHDWGDVRRPWMRKFLNSLAFRPVIAFACRCVNVSDESVRKWRKLEPAFDEAVKRALEIGEDSVLEAALTRAVDGVPKAIFGKEDQIIGVEMKYSDGLAEMLLKGFRPQRFREKQQIEVTHGLSPAVLDILKDVRTKRNAPNVRNLPASEVRTLEINDKAQD
jgi:hypothetical protein